MINSIRSVWILAAVVVCVTGTAAYSQSYTFDALELGFFSSPKIGGGSTSQGYLRYRWSETQSSSVGFTYATESFNAEFDSPEIDDSLVLVVNNLYRLDLVPWERQLGRNRLSLGINTSIESVYEYGFFATNALSAAFGEDVIAFEEFLTRVFVSPRIGWNSRYDGAVLRLRGSVWLSPLFLVVSAEDYMYRSGAERETTERSVDGIGVGFPEIEIDLSATIANRLQLEVSSIYRYFVLEELIFDFSSNDPEDVFVLQDTEYDSIRLLAAASFPFTLPNNSRFRVGGGLLLFAERNLSDETMRFEPGFSILFGVEP
ncbi:MAG: hypothetical protein EA383_04570 [Spirochaetaceae bacterium]|nr:MAG: hypothetical protein EA383_04570 [Spirochaetaceae bacterium]